MKLPGFYWMLQFGFLISIRPIGPCQQVVIDLPFIHLIWTWERKDENAKQWIKSLKRAMSNWGEEGEDAG